uniref:Uncharacterized protein n=1 Tax=Photinus pyralis TaxID=7054 RepID=A0A1Y1KDS1_PHOPY
MTQGCSLHHVLPTLYTQAPSYTTSFVIPPSLRGSESFSGTSASESNSNRSLAIFSLLTDASRLESSLANTLSNVSSKRPHSSLLALNFLAGGSLTDSSSNWLKRLSKSDAKLHSSIVKPLTSRSEHDSTTSPVTAVCVSSADWAELEVTGPCDLSELIKLKSFRNTTSDSSLTSACSICLYISYRPLINSDETCRLLPEAVVKPTTFAFDAGETGTLNSKSQLDRLSSGTSRVSEGVSNLSDRLIRVLLGLRVNDFLRYTRLLFKIGDRGLESFSLSVSMVNSVVYFPGCFTLDCNTKLGV